MDSPIKNFDEMLSGMLDGMLTEAESVELDREMAKNPSLTGQLNELANLKRSLSVGRDCCSLGPDFARSVTRAAQKRASEMAESAPAWLVSSNHFQKTLSPKSRDLPRSRRLFYAVVLTLAASLLCVFLSVPKLDPQALVPQGIVAIPESDPTQEKMATYEKVELNAKDLLDGKVESDLLVISDDKPADNKPIVPAIKPLESVVSNPLTQPDAPVVKDIVSQLAESDRKTEDRTKVDAIPKQKTNSEWLKNFTFTLVLDVSIDPQAVENRVLERILEKYDIVFTDDLAVNDEQLKLLEESQLVGNVDNIKRVLEYSNIKDAKIRDAIDLVTAEKIANAEEKMGVMFLRSTAKKLSLAMTDVINRVEDFPEFTLNMSDDKSAKILVTQLSSIRVAEGSSGFASRLSLNNDRGNNSPFASSAKRGKPMSVDRRENFKGGMNMVVPERDEMSNALFLLRPAKK